MCVTKTWNDALTGRKTTLQRLRISVRYQFVPPKKKLEEVIMQNLQYWPLLSQYKLSN